MSQVKNVGWNEMRKSKKIQELIAFHQTEDSSHVGEDLESGKINFFQNNDEKYTKMSQVKMLVIMISERAKIRRKHKIRHIFYFQVQP